MLSIFLFLFPAIIEAADVKKYKEDDRIHLSANLTCSNNQSSFFPKINKLSMLRIPVEHNKLKDCSISVKSVDDDKKTSYDFPLTNGDNKVVEFLSLVLFFEKGENTALNWDTSFDTNSCKVNDPINKTCAVTLDENYKYIKVFVASVGTDSKKTPLVSAQMLPSTFVKFGVGGVISDAADFVNKAGDWFKDKF